MGDMTPIFRYSPTFFSTKMIFMFSIKPIGVLILQIIHLKLYVKSLIPQCQFSPNLHAGKRNDPLGVGGLLGVDPAHGPVSLPLDDDVDLNKKR